MSRIACHTGISSTVPLVMRTDREIHRGTRPLDKAEGYNSAVVRQWSCFSSGAHQGVDDGGQDVEGHRGRDLQAVGHPHRCQP